MTLKAIAGLAKPHEGHISLNGKVLFDSEYDINLPPQQRKVGFVQQNYALFPHMTVSDNIAFGIRHLPRKERIDKVKELLKKIGMQNYAHRYPSQLSGGQQQRVAMARSLAPEPEILLLDEPFSALDDLTKQDLILELMALFNNYKCDIVFVTHSLTEAYRLGSRIGVYEKGRLLQIDDKEKLISQPLDERVARLTGAKNLFRGIVSENDNNLFLVKLLDIDTTVRLSLPTDRKWQLNQSVLVGIRPENVLFCNHDGENTVMLNVERISEGITNCTYLLANSSYDENSSLEVVITKTDDICPAIKQNVNVYLAPEKLFIIPEGAKSIGY
jgi:molybdate transport system ATP-binding protein